MSLKDPLTALPTRWLVRFWSLTELVFAFVPLPSTPTTLPYPAFVDIELSKREIITVEFYRDFEKLYAIGRPLGSEIFSGVSGSPSVPSKPIPSVT